MASARVRKVSGLGALACVVGLSGIAGLGRDARRPVTKHARTQLDHGLRGQNADVAALIGVNAVADAAPRGFGLDGAGIRVGVFDEAHARDSHEDLRGRVRRRDASGLGEHATHTTGTIAGEGRGEPRARGMAPAAEVWAFDWLLDLAELEESAPYLAVTSHAYAPTLGWTTERSCPDHPTWRGLPDAREDVAFGRYDRTAAALDALVQRTDLLTVWPAGNERADRGATASEAHYHLGSCSDLYADEHLQELTLTQDTLVGLGVAKNALTVGAVRDVAADELHASRIVPLPVSGFGPADDGRIKPDLVAGGEGVRSTSAAADDAYAGATGTSSATAAVAGAAALLTQLYRQLNGGADPRAAELKALLVHTTREARARGPEPGTGYGLLDAHAAASLLDADAAAAAGGARRLITGTLGAGETLVLRSAQAIPTQTALRVTLAWTDGPGPVAQGGIDDSAPALVDDLDLWLVTPDGVTHRPWSFEGSGAELRARRDRANARDNLEVVDVDATAVAEGGQLDAHVRAPETLRAGRRAFALASSVALEPPEQPVLDAPRYVTAQWPASGTRATLTVQLTSRNGGPVAFRAVPVEPWLAVTPSEGEAPLELTIEADLERFGVAREALGRIALESDEAALTRTLGVIVERACEPACDGVACGPDPRCGMPCGRCGADELCRDQACEPLAESCPHGELGGSLGAALVGLELTASGSEASGSCGGDEGPERALRWTAPASGRYAVTTRGSQRDTVLYARAGGCSGSELACNDDSGGVGSGLGLTLDEGTQLDLFVDAFDDGDGDGDGAPVPLSIDEVRCPSVSLGSRLGQGVASGVTGGGLDFLTGSCGGEGSEEARFAWRAPYAGRFRFALFDPRYQAVLYVRDGGDVGCDGDELDCTFAADIGPIDLQLAADQVVAVIVDGRDGRTGPFTLDVVDADASCAGRCGGASTDGACACDAACVAAGDCCVDACEQCDACRCQRACEGRRCGDDGCGGSCGSCAPGLTCDDGACVIDPCDGMRCDACSRCENGRCVARADGEACEDGDPCSVLDRCEDGACIGEPRDCDDGFACTRDTCDARTGLCESTEQAECCDAGTGCGSVSLEDAGMPDAGSATARGGDGGCGCRAAGAFETRSAGVWIGRLAWLLTAAGTLAVRRFRRREAPWRQLASRVSQPATSGPETGSPASSPRSRI